LLTLRIRSATLTIDSDKWPTDCVAVFMSITKALVGAIVGSAFRTKQFIVVSTLKRGVALLALTGIYIPFGRIGPHFDEFLTRHESASVV
jgi:hypothetical protein